MMMQDEEEAIGYEMESILLSKREWPNSHLIKDKEEHSKTRDALFSRDPDFTFTFKRPDLPTVFISEEFLSFSRKWRLILTIDSKDD